MKLCSQREGPRGSQVASQNLQMFRNSMSNVEGEAWADSGGADPVCEEQLGGLPQCPPHPRQSSSHPSRVGEGLFEKLYVSGARERIGMRRTKNGVK